MWYGTYSRTPHAIRRQTKLPEQDFGVLGFVRHALLEIAGTTGKSESRLRIAPRQFHERRYPIRR
jgi:hypothetical protein